MARFYSPEWIAAFNEAVAASEAPASAPGAGSSTDAPSRFRVAQVVTGAPDGDLRVVLEVEEGRLHLELGEPDERGDEANVTVVVSYEDAAALSRGDVDAARLIGSGRLKVRGNLSLLVVGQALLAAAAGRLGELSAATSY